MPIELYSAVSLQEKQIRLLEIRKGSFLDEVVCSLSTAILSDKPQYDALSYVWGNENADDPIMVDGIPVRVTKNLEAAMRHLRRSDRPMVIWIDALCINQKNTLERNQQVSLMGAIYRGAQEVLAWLGAIDAETSKILSMIELFGGDLMLHWDPDLSPAISAEMVSASQFLGLCNFLGRPWWTRVWTVQEAILPEHLTFVCGQRRVDAEIFFGFSRNFARHMSSCCGQFFISRNQQILRDLRYQVDSLFTMDYFRRRKDYFQSDLSGRDPNFLQQMSYYRSRSCKEPKDKIYGFLNFGIVDYVAKNIKPDYSLSDQIVYEEVAGRTMETRHGLDLLDEVLPEQSLQKETSIGNLPSWVPDWTIPVALDAVQPMFGIRQPHASLRQTRYAGSSKQSVSYHKPGKLALRAAIVGAIGTLGDTRRRNEPEMTTFRFENVVTIQRWRGLAHVDDEPDRLYRDSDQSEDYRFVTVTLKDRDHKYTPTTVDDAFWEVLCSSLLLASPDGLTIGGQAQTQDDLTAHEAYQEALNFMATPTQHEPEQRALQLLNSIFQSIGTKRFLVSTNESALIGLAPFTARVGDQIAVFEGGAGPYIIRKHGDPVEQGYTFVGKAYVHGVMNGTVEDLADFEDIVLV